MQGKPNKMRNIFFFRDPTYFKALLKIFIQNSYANIARK